MRRPRACSVARELRVEDVVEREREDLEQLCELRCDRVHAEHDRAGHELDEDEVQPEVHQHDHAADLGTEAIGHDLAPELERRPGGAAKELAAVQPGPGRHEGGDVCDQQPGLHPGED